MLFVLQRHVVVVVRMFFWTLNRALGEDLLVIERPRDARPNGQSSKCESEGVLRERPHFRWSELREALKATADYTPAGVIYI